MLPVSLQNALKSFLNNGGYLAIIPHPEANIESYNSFLSAYGATTLGEKIGIEQKITQISFSHPLYEMSLKSRSQTFNIPVSMDISIPEPGDQKYWGIRTMLLSLSQPTDSFYLHRALMKPFPIFRIHH